MKQNESSDIYVIISENIATEKSNIKKQIHP